MPQGCAAPWWTWARGRKGEMTARPRYMGHSVEEHVAMGQLIKDAMNAIHAVLAYGQDHGMLYAKDSDKLMEMEHGHSVLERLRCDLENGMFHDHKWLTSRAISIYYHQDERVDAADFAKPTE